MVSKTIKISEENCKWLLALATELQKQRARKISFDETLEELKEKKKAKKKTSNEDFFKIKPFDWGPGTEKASEEIDEIVYGIKK